MQAKSSSVSELAPHMKRLFPAAYPRFVSDVRIVTGTPLARTRSSVRSVEALSTTTRSTATPRLRARVVTQGTMCASAFQVRITAVMRGGLDTSERYGVETPCRQS